MSYIIILLLIILCFWLVCKLLNGYEKDVKNWTAKHGEITSVVEFRVINTGPYFPFKNTYIYKATTTSNHIYWFRFWPPFSPEVYEEMHTSEYKKLSYD